MKGVVDSPMRTALVMPSLPGNRASCVSTAEQWLAEGVRNRREEVPGSGCIGRRKRGEGGRLRAGQDRGRYPHLGHSGRQTHIQRCPSNREQTLPPKDNPGSTSQMPRPEDWGGNPLWGYTPVSREGMKALTQRLSCSAWSAMRCSTDAPLVWIRRAST